MALDILKAICRIKYFELLLLFFPPGLRFIRHADLNGCGPVLVMCDMVGVSLGHTLVLFFLQEIVIFLLKNY